MKNIPINNERVFDIYFLKTMNLTFFFYFSLLVEMLNTLHRSKLDVVLISKTSSFNQKSLCIPPIAKMMHNYNTATKQLKF